MTTLKDLSRTLDLSVTQVSRALNGHSDVSEATRKRVMEAARALNYQPNLMARRLVTGRSGIVGLVMPAIPRANSERLYMRIVGGLSAQFARSGLQFILHIADGAEGIVPVYRQLIDSGSLDGFVLMEPRVNEQRIDYLRERSIPFVVHGRTEEAPDYPFYDIDHRGIAYSLTRHLASLGHRRIALVNGEEGLSNTHHWLLGYRDALREAGLAHDPALHRMAPLGEGHGVISTVRLFTDGLEPPTAVVCSSTLIARGLYRGLSAIGLSIPGDVSIVAHDDMLPDVNSCSFDPPLTCTCTPIRDSWLPLADILVAALREDPETDMQRIDPHEFVERQSVAPPPP